MTAIFRACYAYWRNGCDRAAPFILVSDRDETARAGRMTFKPMGFDTIPWSREELVALRDLLNQTLKITKRSCEIEEE